MLKNIKSKYILKILFSYFDGERKLKLFKYNKNFQNLNGISLINYQLFNGNYFIYEENGLIKEYKYADSDNEKLIFKGEYLNKRRVGKGKEYDDKGNLIFEGEYQNGIKNGNGTEYGNEEDNYFYVKYTGEYSNGERKGKGKEFNCNNKLIFKGEYLNGKRWNGNGYDENRNITYKLKNGSGKVREYDIDGYIIYEKEYLNGKIINSKEYDENGCYYK